MVEGRSRPTFGLMAGIAVAVLVLLAGLSLRAAAASASTGDVYAFGDNQYGQLGNETNSESTNPTPTPTLVTLLDATGAVTQVAAGEEHSLAVTLTGQLYAFGSNKYGQLGSAIHNETEKATSTPTLVTLPGESGTVTQVAAGASFSLAVTSSGQLYAFGVNHYGQLGSTTRNGTNQANPTPTLVTLPGATGPVTLIAAGESFSLAVTSTGQLYAFGENKYGQLGSATNKETTKASPTPTLVTLPGESGAITQIAAGQNFSLVVTSSGQLYTFGSNQYGQLGRTTNKETTKANPTPTLVTLPGKSGTISEVAAGLAHSLVATSSGQLYAFGSNEFGQLGNETNTGLEHEKAANPTPTLVTVPAVIMLGAGRHDSVAVTSTGQMYTFGENYYGQLGQEVALEEEAANPTPTLVELPGGRPVISVAHGPAAYHTLALDNEEAPAVVTGAASSITASSATLSATVNPDELPVSSCRFEYGTTTEYGSSVPCSSLPGSGTSAVAVSASPTGLKAETTYHFRIAATNADGTTYGEDATFETLRNPPAVVTDVASSRTQTSAVLNATVNPEGGVISNCSFEYGTTASYGASVPCSSLPGSGGESPVSVSQSLGGLGVNTTYHYRIVATNEGGTSHGVDQSFTTLPNPPTTVTSAASSVTQTSATLNATVNPNGGNVSACAFEYGTTTEYGHSLPCSSLPGSGKANVDVSASLTGLSAETTYYYRISATNPGGTSIDGDQSFTTSAAVPGPTVATGAASSLTQTTATLNGTVNPNKAVVDECYFEYGTTTAYGSSVPCSSLPPTGDSAEPVSAVATGLKGNTTYYFRLAATNVGDATYGADQSFTTPPAAPAVTTGAASSVTGTTATLNATVNPEGTPVRNCRFEYGSTTEYGSTASCSPSPGSEESPVEVSASLTGLSANTTYYYRIAATNSGGTSYGTGQALSTTASPRRS